MQYLYIKSSIGIRCNTYTLKASWIFDAIHWKGNKDWTWGAQNRVLWCLCITKNWKLLFGRFERTSDICICDAIVRIEKMEMWPISIMANVGEVTDGLWARCWPWQPTTCLPTYVRAKKGTQRDQGQKGTFKWNNPASFCLFSVFKNK